MHFHHILFCRLLVGNPGDYAWGREGLDTIVTQLLNQMDSSGPPPLAKDKINELPFVSITAQQVCKYFPRIFAFSVTRLHDYSFQLKISNVLYVGILSK